MTFERARRWLGFARDDLLRELDRLRVPATGTPGVARRAADRTADRPALAVARHVGFSEVWLTTRLDRSFRYDGPGPDDDIRAFLDATRAWALDTASGIVASDPARLVTDKVGESWTPAKLLRRLVYHSLDHLAEVERAVPS